MACDYRRGTLCMKLLSIYFLYMTEFEINFDLILLYLNLLGLHVIIIIENINPSQKNTCNRHVSCEILFGT